MNYNMTMTANDPTTTASIYNNNNNNNNNRIQNDDFHDSSPASQFNDSNTPDNFHSHSSSRMLAFLLLVGIAITHAIMSGFENMHESKKKQTQHHSQQSAFVQETDDAVSFSSANMNIANNEEIYDSRSVTNADESADLDTMGDFPAATILSRATQLNSLILHLDASDVVDCYVLTRMGYLTNNIYSTNRGGGNGPGVGENNDGNRRKVHRMLDESLAFASNKNSAADQKEELEKDGTSSSSSTSSSTGTSNIPSGPVLIRKSALAFRYHPRVASTHNGPHFSTDYSSSVPLDNLSPGDHLEQQKYFELTLEYGPQRTGVAKTSESIPRVHVDMEIGGQTNSNIGKYVSWENEGRVYHTTQISGEWTEAYYMASITGVVLEKIIQRAVDYTYKRPRYQPFEVVSIPSQQLLLRSSGSDDFVLEMFRDLAELYVDIDPLLVPPRGRVQFYVSDPEEKTSDDDGRRGNGSDGSNDSPNSIPAKQPNPNANPNVKKVKGPVESSLAAVFYENFFNCAHAIKSGDYSMYLPPPPPSLAPTAMPSAVSMVPSNMPSISTGVENATIKTTIEGKKDDNEETYSHTVGYGDANSTAVIEGTKVDNQNNDNYGENNTAAQFDDDQHHHRIRRLSKNHHSDNTTIDEEEIVLDALKTDPEFIYEEKGDDVTPGLSLDDDDDDDTLLDSTDLNDTEESEDDPAEVAEKAAIEAAEKAADAG